VLDGHGGNLGRVEQPQRSHNFLGRLFASGARIGAVECAVDVDNGGRASLLDPPLKLGAVGI